MPRAPKRSIDRPLSLTAVARRSRWREAEARVVVDAWKDSGLSLREFTDQHQLPHKKLERWVCTFRKAEQPTENNPMRFMPVQIKAHAAPVGGAEDGLGPDSMQIKLPTGLSVTVGPGFDAAALKRLVETVRC